MKTFSKESVQKEIPKTFTYHLDNSHGWLEVPYMLLVKLGIHTQITACSFRNGNTAYLEEDYDSLTFYTAFSEFFDLNPYIKQHDFIKGKYISSHLDFSPVRRFRHYYHD